MKRLEDLPLKAVYGDVPQSFERRVQYALRRTEEEKHMRKFTLRTLLLTALLVCLAAAVAYAALSSQTAELFGKYWSEEYQEAIERGELAPGTYEMRLGDVVYTVSDVTVTGMVLGEEDTEIYDDLCSAVLFSGTVRPAEGEALVLADYESLPGDPWNYMYRLYGGPDTIPAGAVSIQDKAAEIGGKIVQVQVVANGILDAQGELLPSTVGYTCDFQEDGSLVYTMEIGLEEPIPRADMENYILSVYIANQELEVDDSGERFAPVGERQSMDWTLEISRENSGEA